MEIFRHLGVDELVRKAGASISASMGIYTGSSLKEVIEAKPRRDGPRKVPLAGLMDSISPVNGTFVTQDMLEPVLVDAARAHGGDLRFSTDCLSVSQDDDGVTAKIQDRSTGSTSTIHAQYLIAADGAKSAIRRSLNISTTGRGPIGHLLNILFTADLHSFVQHREFSLCIINNPSVYGLLSSINNTDRWVFHLSYDPSIGQSPTSYPPSKCVELLRIALGMPDLAIEVQSILPWEPTVQIALSLKNGRIFLAGDAAHQMPPWGGQGANTGIADVHNLCFKLAAILNNQAPPSLLETYEVERLPVGREAAEASAAGTDDKGIISVRKDWETIKGWMRRAPLLSGHGYSYETSSAVCREDTGLLGGWTWRPWTIQSLWLGIDGRPGRRMPHIWITQDNKRISTLDLCGRGFVVLAGADGKAWVDASSDMASNMGVEIAAYCVGAEVHPVAGKGVWEAAAGISSRGAILVRPDDFVVWRERRQAVDCRASLERAMKLALCL